MFAILGITGINWVNTRFAPTGDFCRMEQEKTDNLNSQSLIEHLAELRSCLVISFIAVAAGFALSYYFIRPIADWFFRPLLAVLPEGKHLIFISYQEGFFFT